MEMISKKIRESKSKFLTVMVFIIISATVVNYSLYSLLDVYFDVKTVTEAYVGVQFNLLYTVIVIGIVTGLMLVLLPKESVNEIYKELEGNKEEDNRTDAQILQDMIDDELSKSEDNNN